MEKASSMQVKEIGIWGAIVAILIAGSLFLISLVNNFPSPAVTLQIKNLPQVSKDDFFKGASDSAKVTLIEYADFQCPACASYFPLVKMLSSEFSKNLRIVYRFFPLTNIHKNAMLSAQAGYAAGLQGKFWEMHDKLFENQNAWANLSDPKDTFFEYAKELNLDLPKFKTDATSVSTENFIKDAGRNAAALGVNSTPTFFVNGVHIQNPSSSDIFKKIIQDEINKN